jgi:hypothetical protein
MQKRLAAPAEGSHERSIDTFGPGPSRSARPDGGKSGRRTGVRGIASPPAAGRESSCASGRAAPSGSALRRGRADIQLEPFPNAAPQRVHEAVGVDAGGAKEQSARPKRCARTAPAGGERVAPVRLRRRSTRPVEREFHRVLQRRCGRELAREPPEVRDARKHRGVASKPAERAGTIKKAREGAVDTRTRALVLRPVERDAPLVRVVARRIRRKIARADQEQSQVSTSNGHARAARAQQSVERRLFRSHLDPATIRAHQHHPREPLCRR